MRYQQKPYLVPQPLQALNKYQELIFISDTWAGSLGMKHKAMATQEA